MRAYIRLALFTSAVVAESAFVACGPIGSGPSGDTEDSSTGSSSGSSGSTGPDGGPTTVIVNPTITHQTMDGFGGADTWQPGGPLTTDEGTLFFDPVNGIGLTLLRIGIDGSGVPLGVDVYSDIKLAAGYGVKVWGAPWSPPATDKDNDNMNNGGHLCAAADTTCTGDEYDSWASALAMFADSVNTQAGVPLYGISAQNEPDFTATYASCVYTAAEMVAFLKVLGPKLHALTPPVKLIAPEPDTWAHLWSGAYDYGDNILQDPTAASLVDVLATHDYQFEPIPPPTGTAMTQHIWETEVAGTDAPSVTIDNGVTVATWIYNAIVVGGASAWHHWWLVSQSAVDNEGLLFQPGQLPGDVGDVTNPPKRLYTLGNFSKFVRPGYQRIDVSSAPDGVYIAAFQNPTDQTIAIVAINPAPALASDGSPTPDTTVPMAITGTQTPAQLTPWVTSATENLGMHAAVAVTGGAFTATLPAQTVTTFVGTP